MAHSSIRIIKEEHVALAAMMKVFEQVLVTGPGDAPEIFLTQCAPCCFMWMSFPSCCTIP
jgi:hypothetical protein